MAWFVLAAGAIVGSFLNVCIYRIPKDLSVVLPRSFCPHCKAMIPWYENIPLLSYLLLRGKCFRCRKPIAFRYFLVELTSALIAWFLWQRYGLSAEFLAGAAFFALLLVATMTDFETGLIPDKITVTGMILGLALSVTGHGQFTQAFWYQKLLASAAGLLAGGAIVYAMVEIGKFFFGKRKVYLEPHTVITLKKDMLVIDQKPGGQGSCKSGGQCSVKSFLDFLLFKEKLDPSCKEFAWEDLFNRASDRILFCAATLKFQDKCFKDVDVEIAEKTLKVSGAVYPLSEIGTVEGVADRLVIPREAMGGGDVKLLAMIGAFVGAKNIGLVFLLAPFPALPFAFWQRFVKKEETIPFGPFLALAGAFIFLTGDAILNFVSKKYGV